MAGSLNTPGRGRGRRSRPMAEINVTPLVDVMLVLLIIFMVAAPLMTSGVAVDLPRTNAAALTQDQEPLTITVNPEGRIFVQDTEVPMEGLVTQLRAILENQPAGAPERRIFVRGDRTIAYGRVMEVMGTVSSAGFSRVALLAEQPAGRPTTGAPARPGQPARGPATSQNQSGQNPSRPAGTATR